MGEGLGGTGRKVEGKYDQIKIYLNWKKKNAYTKDKLY